MSLNENIAPEWCYGANGAQLLLDGSMTRGSQLHAKNTEGTIRQEAGTTCFHHVDCLPVSPPRLDGQINPATQHVFSCLNCPAHTAGRREAQGRCEAEGIAMNIWMANR